MRTRTASRSILAWMVAGSTLVACADATASQRPGAHDGAPAFAADADRTVVVEATAPFAFSPDELAIEVGETITFEVVNVDVVDHDFVLGDEATQQAHADDMRGMVGMDDDETHEQPNAVSVPAGATSTITWTFSDPGPVLYGCHEPGHYEAGMLGTITVRA